MISVLKSFLAGLFPHYVESIDALLRECEHSQVDSIAVIPVREFYSCASTMTIGSIGTAWYYARLEGRTSEGKKIVYSELIKGPVFQSEWGYSDRDLRINILNLVARRCNELRDKVENAKRTRSLKVVLFNEIESRWFGGA